MLNKQMMTQRLEAFITTHKKVKQIVLLNISQY